MPIKKWEIGKEMVWAFVLMLVFTNQLSIVAQAVPNGDFENWKTNRANILEPDGWETQNDAQLLYVERAEGHSGNYAICLNVVWDKMVQSFSGANISTESKIGEHDEIRKLTGFYKGVSDGDDTLRISITVFSDGKTTGYGSLDLLNSDDNWRPFNLPIKSLARGHPETFQVFISVVPAKGSHNLTKYSIDDLTLSE